MVGGAVAQSAEQLQLYQQYQQQLQQRGGATGGNAQITNSPADLSAPDLQALQEQRQIQAANDLAQNRQRDMLDLPPEPDIEFQDFVTSSLGYHLAIFGQSLFRTVPSTFAPLDRVPVTPDYLIGPGDELLIRVWGQVDVNYRAVVDRNGAIYVPRIGAISVAGTRYDQLHSVVQAAISRVYKNFELNITMGQLRSIQVFVVGQVRRPGTYTVSSLSSLVNALFASGGPSKRGSMRRIMLKRQGKEVTSFDLYDLLANGDKSKDAQLLPGDVIYIPPVGPLIAVAGSVNVPAIYELREGASLKQALDMAGGLTTTADGQKAVVERIENRSTRKVEEFPLDEKGLQRPLTDGDVVRIFSLSPRFDNAVTLHGNVAHPGRYEWHSGLRLRDLIPSPEALLTRDYWRDINSVSTRSQIRDARRERALRAELQGKSAGPDDLEASQDPNSRAAIRASTENVKADPAQPEAEKSEFSKLEFREDIKHGVPEINWDYAVIQRLNRQDLSMELL